MPLLKENITGKIGLEKYACKILWRNGTILMDEPELVGGKDTGPDPYTTLLAALAGCTLSTLRMYIDRKGWNIPFVEVKLNMSQTTDMSLTTEIQREIIFPTDINQEQIDRLIFIAKKCPVSKLLESKIQIKTYV